MIAPAETILVTGSAGFIGSHLVDRLLTSGATVIGVDNFDPFYPAAEKRANIEAASAHDAYLPLALDCTDLSSLITAVPDVPISAVVHLAAKAGVRPSLRDPVEYAHTNVVGTQAVLEFARQRRIQRIVFGSSSSVYGNAERAPFDEETPTVAPISPYAATKSAGELLCTTHAHLHRAAVIALRFFTVYGPRQRPDLAIRKFATLMLKGRPLPLNGDGSSERDYSWIDDIIDGVMAAITRTRSLQGRCEAINLGGGRTTSLRRLVALLELALGVEAVIEPQPYQSGDVHRTWAGLAKAERLLGYRPRVSIEEGIPRFARWLSAHGAGRRTQAGPLIELMAEQAR